jgi:hypothetical protein
VVGGLAVEGGVPSEDPACDVAPEAGPVAPDDSLTGGVREVAACICSPEDDVVQLAVTADLELNGGSAVPCLADMHPPVKRQSAPAIKTAAAAVTAVALHTRRAVFGLLDECLPDIAVSIITGLASRFSVGLRPDMF